MNALYVMPNQENYLMELAAVPTNPSMSMYATEVHQLFVDAIGTDLAMASPSEPATRSLLMNRFRRCVPSHETVMRGVCRWWKLRQRQYDYLGLDSLNAGTNRRYAA